MRLRFGTHLFMTCKLIVLSGNLSWQNFWIWTKNYQNPYLFHKLCKNLLLALKVNHNSHSTSQCNINLHPQMFKLSKVPFLKNNFISNPSFIQSLQSFLKFFTHRNVFMSFYKLYTYCFMDSYMWWLSFTDVAISHQLLHHLRI